MRGEKSKRVFIAVFLIIGIVFTGIMLVFTVINIDIKNHYTPVDAVIIGFERHKSSSSDGEKHRFVSADLRRNINSHHIGKEATVYYQPNNMNNYFVDIDSLFEQEYKSDERRIYH